jgi:thiamine biosynthesis lipoprotein
MKRIEFHAMGSRMMAAVDGDSRAAEEALQRVPEWFEEWEQVLSRFRPDSELSRLNRSTGRPVEVSETLWEVFHAAREAERFTAGLVTPTVLEALLLAGYDHSFELLPPAISGDGWTPAASPDLSTAVGWEASTRTLILPEAVRLDLGGVAKGWAAQRAAKRLARYAPALVDAGGDIAVSGLRKGGIKWPVGIGDPFHPENYFEILDLGGGGVATSGKDYHRWQREGAWMHHIIDPRSGSPAVTDILTATVVAPTVLVAEAAAKAALILGSQAGLDWIDTHAELAVVLVLEGGEALYSVRMKDYLRRSS